MNIRSSVVVGLIIIAGCSKNTGPDQDLSMTVYTGCKFTHDDRIVYLELYAEEIFSDKGGTAAIRIMDRDGGNDKKIYQFPDPYVRSKPVPSYTNDKIVVHAMNAVLDFNGNTVRPLGDIPETIISWSPDETYILVDSGETGTYQVYDLDGSLILSPGFIPLTWYGDNFLVYQTDSTRYDPSASTLLKQTVMVHPVADDSLEYFLPLENLVWLKDRMMAGSRVRTGWSEDSLAAYDIETAAGHAISPEFTWYGYDMIPNFDFSGDGIQVIWHSMDHGSIGSYTKDGGEVDLRPVIYNGPDFTM